MKTVGLIAFFVAAVLVQVSFLPGLRPWGVVPDVVMVVVILAGFGATVSRALVLAIGGGIVLDLVSGADFGLRTGLFVIAALGPGAARRGGLTLGGPLVALGLVGLATLVQTLVIIANLSGHVTSWPVASLTRTFAVELMINLLLTILLRPVVVWLLPKDAALPVIE